METGVFCHEDVTQDQLRRVQLGASVDLDEDLAIFKHPYLVHHPDEQGGLWHEDSGLVLQVLSAMDKTLKQVLMQKTVAHTPEAAQLE